MLISNIINKYHWQSFLKHPIWDVSMQWLLDYSSSAELGTYPLGKDGWYANVHQYHTKEQNACVWESHQHTVDIQYIMSGKERILWAPIAELEGPIRTVPNFDRQEWNLPKSREGSPSSLEMKPGVFAVFMANEGHCPMISIDTPELIRKTVIKIPTALLSS